MCRNALAVGVACGFKSVAIDRLFSHVACKSYNRVQESEQDVWTSTDEEQWSQLVGKAISLGMIEPCSELTLGGGMSEAAKRNRDPGVFISDLAAISQAHSSTQPKGCVQGSRTEAATNNMHGINCTHAGSETR